MNNENDLGFGVNVSIESVDKMQKELKAAKEQLDEANKAIDEFREHGVCSLLNVYHAKHLKPVDERFEKFQEFMDYYNGEKLGYSIDGHVYNKFLELFPKDNGTAGLDELKSVITGNVYTKGFLHKYIDKIKTRLQARSDD